MSSVFDILPNLCTKPQFAQALLCTSRQLPRVYHQRHHSVHAAHDPRAQSRDQLPMITSDTQSSASRLGSYLSSLSPIPAFPEYTGPYQVGTVDVEIPTNELPTVSAKPEGVEDVETVQFRIFYPAVEGTEQRISWLPNPQRQHVAAYTKFLGAGNALAELLSFIPRHLHYTTIPAHKNAELHEATTDSKRWPTMIFSHGLGGSRNSYSYIAGSLASHGVVVICPDHRDGSAVTSFVRVPASSDTSDSSASSTSSEKRRIIPYNRVPHDVCPETYEARDKQLRIRAWELGLVHQAILAIDKGVERTNLNTSTPSLDMFEGKMNVHEPGSIIFAGHSFGATTMYQLLKSTYYADKDSVAMMERPIFRPERLDGDLRKQITERTVTMLLDMWCMPIMSPTTSALFDLPLPLYDDKPTSAGGDALLAIESQAFYKWTEHLNVKARVLSPNPSHKKVSPETFEKPSGIRMKEPNFFYVVHSAHLSQSDFGILFPWLTKKIFAAVEPERALRLNLRAQLQHFRNNGITVARTAAVDLVDGSTEEKVEAGVDDDQAILDRGATVDCWEWIDLIGLGNDEEGAETVESKFEEGEKDMEGELEMDMGDNIGTEVKKELKRTLSGKTQ